MLRHSWRLLRPSQLPTFFVDMGSRYPTNKRPRESSAGTRTCGNPAGRVDHGNRLGSILAHAAVGGGCIQHIAFAGSFDRLLDLVLAVALEVPRRSDGGLADCAAADCTRILCAGGAWAAQPARTLVGITYRAHPGFHVQRTCDLR